MKKLSKARIIKINKDNARLYPIYKMLSMDLLFYYAISFVFLTTVKGFSFAEVLLIESFVPMFKAMLQLPLNLLIERIGKKKSLAIGCFCIIIYLVQLISATSLTSLIFASFVYAFGSVLKDLTASNILFESLNNKKGRGMYSQIEERGTYYYYYLDAGISIVAGFLFVVNGYYPMIVSFMFAILSFLISLMFRETKFEENKRKVKLIDRLEEDLSNTFDAFRHISKSSRLKSLLLFGSVFGSYSYVLGILRRAMLAGTDIEPQFFALIFAGLILAGGISTRFINKFKNIFKKKILSYIAITFVTTGILAALVILIDLNQITTTILLLILFLVQYIVYAPYNSLMEKYLKSFSRSKSRLKIKVTYNINMYLAQTVITFITSYMLGYIEVGITVALVSLVYYAAIFITLNYMKGRVGLNPLEYSNEDIELLNTKNIDKPV